MIKELIDKFQKILAILTYINKLIYVINELYETKNKNKIQTLINLKNEIREGLLNYTEKEDN